LSAHLLRRHWLIIFAAFCVAGWAVRAGTAGAVPVTPVQPDPWAGSGMTRSTGGPYLEDAEGRRLQLHGADLAAKCGGGARPIRVEGSPCVGPATGSEPAFVLSPTTADPGRRFTAADARTLALLGFTVVRLGIIWEGLEPGPAGARPNDPSYCARHAAGTRFPALGAADPYRAAAVRSYLARTDRIVDELAGAGIRVIVDMHQDIYGSAFSYRSGPSPWNGEGAPPWATCTDGKRFAGVPYWAQAYGDPVVGTAIRHFWHNDVRADLQGQFARVWQAVARHYRGDPEVIGYEVLNEPTEFFSTNFNAQLQCAYAGPARAPRSCAASHVQALRTGLIGAIESADPGHLVVFEPMITGPHGGSERIGISEPLRFPRLVLAVHVYGIPGHNIYGCPGRICLKSERAQFAAVVRDRSRTRTDQPGGPAMIVDEFGGSPDITDLGQVVDLARASSLSWSYWSALQLHDPTGGPGEGLLNTQTRQPWPAKAKVLSFPYPLATAGVPGPQSWDATTHRFHFTFTVDPHVHAPTEIVVPPYDYPDGYRVEAQGALGTSAPGASLLDLSTLPGSSQVSVTVLPAVVSTS
jgi:endoglycosylceramidase